MRILLQFIVINQPTWLASLVVVPMPRRLRAASGGTPTEAIRRLIVALAFGVVLPLEPILGRDDHLADCRFVEVLEG